MWSLEAPSERPPTDDAIIPSKVLYRYDGPTIFTAQLGLTNTLFLKVDELDGGDLFLAAPTTRDLISALEAGKISVYGAMLSSRYWIIETDGHLSPTRYWELSAGELPDDFLPEPGVALFAHLGSAPDTIEQAQGFFSIAFRGQDMTAQGMPFSTFKNLVNNAYDATRKILSPLMLQGTKSSTFDFSIFEPKFGSLIISVESPIINEIWADQNSEEEDDLLSDLNRQVSEQRTDFFNKMGEVVFQARQGEIAKDFSADDRDIIDKLKHVIPNDDGNISNVEFTASFGETTSTLKIDRQIGGRIHRAYERSEKAPTYVSGAITEINAEKRTFRIKNAAQRQITCTMDHDTFDELVAEDELYTGRRVGLNGVLTRRKRIDLFNIEEPIRFLA